MFPPGVIFLVLLTLFGLFPHLISATRSCSPPSLFLSRSSSRCSALPRRSVSQLVSIDKLRFDFKPCNIAQLLQQHPSSLFLFLGPQHGHLRTLSVCTFKGTVYVEVSSKNVPYQVIHSVPKRLSLSGVQETCIACLMGEVGNTWQARQS